MQLLTVQIKTRPITFNNAYPSNRSGKRYLSERGKEFKRQVLIHTRQAILDHGFKYKHGVYYSLEIHFYIDDLFTKEGNLKKTKPDTDGCIKLMQDAIFEAMGADDYLALDYEGVYMHLGNNEIYVIIREYPIESKKNFELPNFF